MLRASLLFVFVLTCIYSNAQERVHKYSTDELNKEAKGLGDFLKDKSPGKRLYYTEKFTRDKVFNGNPEHDSISLLYHRARFYHGKSDKHVEYIHSGLMLLSKHSNSLDDDVLEMFYRKVGETYLYTGNEILAKEFLIESLNYYSRATRAYVQSQIGQIHIRLGDYESAIKRYELALKVALDQSYRVSQYNSLGFVHYLNKDYTESDNYYKLALGEFAANTEDIDSIQYYIVLSNVSSLRFATGDSKKGFEILKKIHSAPFFQKQENWFKSEVYGKFVTGYIEDLNCAQARFFLNELEGTLSDDPLGREHLNFLESSIRIENLCGHGEEADRLMVKYRNKLDSIEIFEEKRGGVIQSIQRSVYQDHIKLVSANLKLKESSQASLELANGRLLRIFIVSGVLFLVVVFFFVIRFRQIRLKRDLIVEKEKSTDLQIKFAQQEMENKRLELSKILTSIDKSSSLSGEVLSRLSSLKAKEGDVKDDISQLIQFIKSMSRADSINELVEKNSDVLGFGLKERIETKFPDLTASELQLIILIRIGLSTKEIAQLKNVEPSSVRIFKHRLKIKLQVHKEDNLTDFIIEL